MKRWLLLISLLVSQLAFADQLQWEFSKQLHPHMVPFKFQLWVNRETEFDPYAYLKILDFENNEIHRITSMHLEQSKDSLDFIDVNFDGTLELRVDNNSFSEKDQFWFYDTASATFKENKVLGDLKNPIFDKEQQQVITKWQDKHNQSLDYYQFDGNELVLVRQVMIQCDEKNNCEKIEMLNNEGILAEASREQVEHGNTMQKYLDNLITRKGLCLANIKEFELKGDKQQGLKEASLCLNTIAYELMPTLNQLAKVNQSESVTLQLKELLDKYADFIRLVTLCADQQSCEMLKEDAARKATIKLTDSLIETMVVNIASSQLHFQKDKWLAKWTGLNDIMQG